MSLRTSTWAKKMLKASPVFIPSRKNLFSPFQTIRWNSRAKKSGISHRSNTLKSAQSSTVGFFATPDGAFGIEACPKGKKTPGAAADSQ